MHKNKAEWDFLTDNGNLFRKYLPEYGSGETYPPGKTVIQMSTSRSQSEIEKDKNEGFNLAPCKADPATRTNTPSFYINNEYQELPKQAYITDKPYTFWANNLRGCIGVLNNQSEILGHIYLKVCELEGSSFKESTQELGDGRSEIQPKQESS